MAQKGKPAPQAKKSPDPTILKLQEELKAQGYYFGEPDGIPGDKTEKAAQARREDQARAEQRRIDEINAQTNKTSGDAGKVKSDAEAAALAAQTARKQRYDDQASSALGLATQTGANALMPALATAGGVIAGGKINKEMDLGQEGRNRALRGAAADRVAGLTTREGARMGTRLAGAMPSENALLRVGSRMAPHLALGGIGIGKGMQVLNESDPNGEFYSQMADRAAGLGWIGAGTGIMKQGIRYAASPGVSPDAQALSVINSNQLRRNPVRGGMAPQDEPDGNSPRSVTSEPPRAGTERALRAQARELKIPGRSGMGKAELADAVAESIRQQGATRAKRLPKLTSAVAGPAMAAGLAYAATPSRAEAADGSSGGGSQAEALTNAGIAGGAAYGVNRLLRALPATVGGALSTMGPMSVATMDEPAPEVTDQYRNLAARTLPRALQFGAVDDAYQAAQVPEPSPYRQQPLDAAQSLEVPQGIPAPNEDGSSPYGDPVGGEGDFETQMAELTAMLSEIGATQEQGPVANAVQSQRVASMPQQQPMYQPQMQRNALLR